MYGQDVTSLAFRCTVDIEVAHILLKRLIALRSQERRGPRRAREILLRGTSPAAADHLWYRSRLRELVRRLDAASVEVIDELHPSWPRAHDAAPADLDAAIARAAARFGGVALPARRVAGEIVRRVQRSTDARLAGAMRSALGIDIGDLLHEQEIAGALQAALRANVDLITSLPPRHFARLRKAVAESFATGERWEGLAARIHQVTKATTSDANRIARDQTSKMSGKFNEIRQVSLGIEEYIWQDVGDGKVRPSHRALHGSRQRWDSPPLVDGERAHPRDPIQCRCNALPVISLAALERRAAA